MSLNEDILCFYAIGKRLFMFCVTKYHVPGYLTKTYHVLRYRTDIGCLFMLFNTTRQVFMWKTYHVHITKHSIMFCYVAKETYHVW